MTASLSASQQAIEVFFSYAHRDEELRDELAKHLRLLERQKIIAGWHDRRIPAGGEWAGDIDAHLRTAHIILLLVSADFLASDYCYDIEVRQAMARHEANEARVIPIIVRPVDWHSAPFGTLQALPKDGRAVTSWPNRDEAFVDITRGIRVVAQEIAHRLSYSQAHTPPVMARYQLPPPPRDFTGRTTELASLYNAVVQEGRTLCGLYGLGGVGKTALTLKLAEQLAVRYPDAQLYLDLKGMSAVPLSVAEAMAYVISAYHPTEPIPTNEAVLRGRYQSVLHGQRAIVLMDNAASREQVEPLLPPTSCLLLITSRRSFTLPGLFAMNLTTLRLEEARTLVGTIAPHLGMYAYTLAQRCGFLPLALRVAASTLAEHIDLSPHVYIQRLADAQQRLNLVDASLSLSFDLLSLPLQQQWCLLALFPSLFDVDAAAEVLELDAALTQDIVSTLVRSSLVEWAPEMARYRLHDLARVFVLSRLERSRERVPLDWATTQTALGNALWRQGEREAGTTRLEEAVQAYRAALEERTRERVPLQWALTQTNLGNALWRQGEREAGTTRLEEAVQACRLALEERTRTRMPLQWALTQTTLGNALWTLGEREAGTTRLEEAVQAYQAALEEYTRERMPLQWALTQTNLGNALVALGERESGTARLEEAVQACREALQECTRERVPLDWALTQTNLGNALITLGDREGRTTRLEEAVQAYRLALEERTRERVPLDWAATQSSLGNALAILGEREDGTTRLEEAVQAYRLALEERTRVRVPLQWALTQNSLGSVLRMLGERKKEVGLIAEALEKHTAAWKIFVETLIYYALEAMNEVQKDIEVLKRDFTSTVYQDCLTRYSEVLARMNLL